MEQLVRDSIRNNIGNAAVIQAARVLLRERRAQ
jgi:hypothetical protein